MKGTLSVIALLFTLNTLAQDTLRFTVSLKGRLGEETRPLPLLLDTIYLETRPKQTLQTFQQVAATDSLFQLPALAVGKYWLRFATLHYCVMPLPIVVCSKCDNTFSFFAFLKQPQDNCDNFTSVEISASYKGGEKALAKDFQNALSKQECKQIKASKDFTVQFYLTKQGMVSDISFTSNDISQEVKNSISKALESLTNWNPAVRNGMVVDAEYKLGKETLLAH